MIIKCKTKNKREYELSFDSPTNQELMEIVESDNLTYPIEQDRADFDSICVWRDSAPNSFILIKHKGKLIGYIILLPLTKKSFDDYKNGKITEADIGAKEIVEWDKNPYVLFNNVSINPEYQNSEAVFVLTFGIAIKLFLLNQNGIKLNNVVAEVDSPDGKKYLTQRFGFIPLNKRNIRHNSE